MRDVQGAGLADGAADQTAEHISLVDFAGGDAVRHNERGGADMFDDDAFGAGTFFCGDRSNAAEFVEFGEERGEKLGQIAAALALQDGGDAFDAHAGIDVLLLQRLIFAFGILVILHEHIVPDLDPEFVFGIEDFRSGERSGPVEHFGIGTAGAGLTGRTPPVVFLGQFGDAFFTDAERTPFVVRFLVERSIFVAGEHGHGQAVDRNIEVVLAGKEFETEFDGLILEIVTERPVAEHFEEGKMDGIADFIDIAGADAFLDVGEALSLGMLAAEQIRNQRMHARGGKEDGGVIIGDQGRAFDDRMSFGMKEIDVFFT